LGGDHQPAGGRLQGALPDLHAGGCVCVAAACGESADG
jgi:hypothetical protein